MQPKLIYNSIELLLKNGWWSSNSCEIMILSVCVPRCKSSTVHILHGSAECCKGRSWQSLKMGNLKRYNLRTKKCRPMKLSTIHYVVGPNKTPKFRKNRPTPNFPSICRSYILRCAYFGFFCFLKIPTGRHGWPIWTNDTPERVFGWKEVPFWGEKCWSLNFDT